jgi:hypothetical protein
MRTGTGAGPVAHEPSCKLCRTKGQGPVTARCELARRRVQSKRDDLRTSQGTEKRHEVGSEIRWHQRLKLSRCGFCDPQSNVEHFLLKIISLGFHVVTFAVGQRAGDLPRVVMGPGALRGLRVMTSEP